MTTTTTDVRPRSSPEAAFRSPQRCLLHAARKSRQRWKLKAQHHNRAIKRLKVRVHDLEASRLHHRQLAQRDRTALQQAQQQIALLQDQLAARTTTPEPTPSLPEKKTLLRTTGRAADTSVSR